MSEEIKNPWKTLSGEAKYDNRWINVTEYQVINPAGGKGIYGKIHFKNKGIGIIPVDEEGNTWLVGQYRYTLNEFHWEIPEGGGPLDESPLLAAKRELQEETGIIAKKWTPLLRNESIQFRIRRGVYHHIWQKTWSMAKVYWKKLRQI